MNDKEDIYNKVKEKIDNESMNILVERNYGYLRGEAGGSKDYIKKWRRIYKYIYRYYGVFEDDVRNKMQ